MKWLRIIGTGVATWGLTLMWMDINRVLMSSYVVSIAVVMLGAMPAYWWGHYFARQTQRTSLEPPVIIPRGNPLHSQATQPLRAPMRESHLRERLGKEPTRPSVVIKPGRTPTRPLLAR